MNISVDNDSKVKRIAEGAIGIGAGYATYSYAKDYTKKPYSKYLMKQCEKLPHNESLEFSRGAKTAFIKNNLGKKGIEIVDLRPDNFYRQKDSIIKTLKKRLNLRTANRIGSKKTNTSKFSKKIEDAMEKIHKKQLENLERGLKEVSEGKNACYMPALKNVYVNPDKMGFSTFHELGHAINHTSSGFKGALSKSRNFIALAAPVILFTSIVKRKKTDEEKPKNIFDRFTRFIKNNCGKLMFLAMVPTLAEEGLASINGAKLAKDTLKPDMLKKMNNLNLKAWGSYAIGALAMSLCGALAVWVKDRVAQPELAKK